MKIYSYIFIFLLLPILVFSEEGNLNMFEWDYPSPEEQLAKNKIALNPGKSGIFIPAMTDPQLEPMCSIFKGDTLIKVSETGKIIYVDPGKYIVKIGSGTIKQFISIPVVAPNEHIVTVPVEWSGMVITIMDDTKNYWDGSYEIFNLITGESFGIGKGANENIGERPRTWILPPGVYKIVKLGENFNTLRNFITVRISKKELARILLVVDSQYHNFIGGGLQQYIYNIAKNTNWKFSSNIDGYFTFDQTNYSSTKENLIRLALSNAFDIKAIYETPKHYFKSGISAEEGISKESGKNIRKYSDNVEVRNMYVFRLFNRVGPYARLDINTSLFPEYYYFDSPTNIMKIDENGNVIENCYNMESIEISPSFYPLYLKEGLGLNIQALRGFYANLSVRIGLGLRQTIMNNNFAKSDTSDVVFYKLSTSTLTGLELSYNLDARIWNNIFFYSEFDIISSFSDNSTTSFDWNNRVSFHLSKNIAVDYTFSLSRDESIFSGYDLSQRLLIHFSLSFF